MRSSFSTKIGIVVAVLITLSIFSFAFVHVTFEANRRTQELIEEKRNLNEMLAFSIESAEYQALTWYKKYIIEKAAEPEDVVYCRLVKPAGEIFLSSIEEERGLYITDPVIHTNQTIIRNDVFNGEKIIVVVSPTYRGQTLWLGFSLSKVNAAVMGILTEAVIMAVIATLICVPTSYFIVSRSLSPIKKLTDICKHVSERDLKVRADVQSSDEIGLLSKTFNDMIARLDRDIAERKKIQEALAESEEKYRTLFERYSVLVEEASDGVVIIQDGKIVFTNKRASEISGYSRDELIGLSLEKLLDEKYRQLAKERYYRRLQGERVPATFEVEFIAKTAERIPVEASATRINYQGRPADLVIVRDIRERKRMEEERLKLERLAAIGEAAAMVGHDLRNPLQAIVNTLFLAKEKLKSIPTTDRKIVEKHGILEWGKTLEEQVRYMNKIVSDLQDYARPVRPEPLETSLPQLIDDALSTITVPETVKVSKVIPVDFPKLMVDPALMRRVFTNLIINALQAMPDRGQLTIRSSKTGETAFISVQDTGVGIPKEDLPKLFQPLFTTKSKGQGFGLPVCKRLVEAHGGSITVESEVGRGSTFTVKIPLRRGMS